MKISYAQYLALNEIKAANDNDDPNAPKKDVDVVKRLRSRFQKISDLEQKQLDDQWESDKKEYPDIHHDDAKRPKADFKIEDHWAKSSYGPESSNFSAKQSFDNRYHQDFVLSLADHIRAAGGRDIRSDIGSKFDTQKNKRSTIHFKDGEHDAVCHVESDNSLGPMFHEFHVISERHKREIEESFQEYPVPHRIMVRDTKNSEFRYFDSYESRAKAQLIAKRLKSQGKIYEYTVEPDLGLMDAHDPADYDLAQFAKIKIDEATMQGQVKYILRDEDGVIRSTIRVHDTARETAEEAAHRRAAELLGKGKKYTLVRQKPSGRDTQLGRIWDDFKDLFREY